ncbi:ABC transporter ATP-binding protein [Achromobacter sp. F4_2707]|uniref:ABC transporter ATP-binding protein n=1 Tax=Achromobacter sp. F4_2707 TaxID=3114286 RepID=UPI0039C6B61E
MLDLRNVSLAYGPRQVLREISLQVAAGERFGLLGASGNGKSSLLRIAAGITAPSSGSCINQFLSPILLFQEPRLLPWRRVRENLEIPLRAMGLSKEEATERSLEWLYNVDLKECAESWPSELSGGMAQRAALARAFAMQPDLLLLDEPFSALDPALRNSLSNLCMDYIRTSGAAMICSSHHPQELVRMVDHCLLIHQGQLLHYTIDAGNPQQVAQELHTRLTEQETAPP